MMLSKRILFCFLCLAFNGCVSSDDGSPKKEAIGVDEVDTDFEGPAGTIVGQVWAPGNAPGMVPDKHEIPVSGALIWLSTREPRAIPQNTYCQLCEKTPRASVFSLADGYFSLDSIFPGDYWITIQKGQFRISQEIRVEADKTIYLQPLQTTLPSVQSPEEGKWIPRMALVDGAYDTLEDVIGKMKIGSVDSDGAFEGPSSIGVFDLYRSEGRFGSTTPTPYLGSAEDLFQNLPQMLEYHIIFIPCDSSNGLIYDEDVRRNIREFVRSGGKLYVTDWSSEFEDGIFPEFIVFEEDYDTVSSENILDGDGGNSYSSEAAYAVHPGLNAWLDLQTGPDIFSNEKRIDGNDFMIEGNWNRIVDTPRVFIGEGDEGLPVYETAEAWVLGDWDNDGIMHPLTLSFEPEGCGRVLYSTYHTTDDTHVGLTPQERVLLFLIMEIGECKSGIVIE